MSAHFPPTTEGLYYWKPESDREWEVVYLQASLTTFLCLGSGEQFAVGYMYWEEWGGTVTAPEELTSLRTDREVLDWVISKLGVSNPVIQEAVEKRSKGVSHDVKSSSSG